jgi:hypothetical protein
MLQQNHHFLTEPNNSKYSANSGHCPPPLIHDETILSMV